MSLPQNPSCRGVTDITDDTLIAMHVSRTSLRPSHVVRLQAARCAFTSWRGREGDILANLIFVLNFRLKRVHHADTPDLPYFVFHAFQPSVFKRTLT